MSVLTRKIVRTIRGNLGQTLAVSAVIMCGVACLIAFTTAHRNLVLTKGAYYAENSFADFEIMLERAPNTVLFKLEEIPGVRRVRGRVVEEAKLDLGNGRQARTGRLVSMPRRAGPVINNVVVTEGRYFEQSSDNEVIVSSDFAEKNELRLGETLDVTVNGRRHTLRIVGFGKSPEYIYIIRSIQDMIPSPERFGILWVTEEFAESAVAMQEACNNIVGIVDDPEQLDAVLESAETILDAYGVFGTIKAEDQVSNQFVSNEIKGLESTMRVIPPIFLGIASLVIAILMNRMVRNERTQIGLMKAYGHSNASVALHYLQYAAILGLIGSAAGGLLGQWSARQMMGIYGQFYQFPELYNRFYPDVLMRGTVIAVFFALAGAGLAARQAARIHPAESMRPEAPKTARRSGLERFPALWRRLSFTSKMIARNIARHPFRAGLNAFGVMVSCGLLIIGLFMLDAVEYLIRFQFEISQRQDARVTLITERGEAAYREVARYDHVRAAEPQLQYPFEMRNGWHKKDVLVIGLPEGGRLQRLLDADEQEVAIPKRGLVLSEHVAAKLGVEVGDSIQIEPLLGKIDIEKEIVVAKIVKQYFGSSAYMNLEALSDVLGESLALNAVLVKVDPGTEAELVEHVRDVPGVATVEIRKDAHENLKKTLGRQMAISAFTTILFAGIISFSVIYNVTTVSLAERQRELASLRILGFSRQEVGRILFHENFITGAIGLALGVPFGAAACRIIIKAFDTDLFRLPYYIENSTILVALGLSTSFIVFANLAVRRKLAHMDLIEVLKSRE